MCKMSLWLDQFSKNNSDDKFHPIPNSIELALVGWTPAIFECFGRGLNMLIW